MLGETLGLTSSEFASVLATSGTTSAEGESMGSSWKFAHLADAKRARDSKARKSEAEVAAVTFLTCLDFPRPRLASNMQLPGMMQINECEDDDDEYFEEDVDWYTGDCDNELDGTAYTVGTPTDDPELLEQFDGSLEDADAFASQVYAPARRCFQGARELLSRVESARGYFPVVSIGAFDGLAQPSTDRKPAKFRGKGKKGKRKGKSSSQRGGKSPNLGKPGILPKPQTSRSESRPPLSKTTSN